VQIYHNEKIVNTEPFEELKSNVTWPDWAEVQRQHCCCCFFNLIHVATWGVDEFFKALAGFFLKLAKILL
jgi:preprotein translocase subunit SecE